MGWGRWGPWITGRHETPWVGLGRMRRGDVRAAVLRVLSEGPAHGYQVIRTLEERSGGLWRPSPGSVYPTLQMLEDEGLVRSTEQDGKRVYELTEAGDAEAGTQHVPQWEAERGGGERARGLREAVGQLHVAAKQVAQAGEPEQIEAAVGVIRDARSRLYQLLAES
jgi:DNA-binding PadR family transcriptional regulator